MKSVKLTHAAITIRIGGRDISVLVDVTDVPLPSSFADVRAVLEPVNGRPLARPPLPTYLPSEPEDDHAVVNGWLAEWRWDRRASEILMRAFLSEERQRVAAEDRVRELEQQLYAARCGR